VEHKNRGGTEGQKPGKSRFAGSARLKKETKDKNGVLRGKEKLKNYEHWGQKNTTGRERAKRGFGKTISGTRGRDTN